MIARILSSFILLCLMAVPSAVLADNFILTDRFDGSESTTDPLPGTCNPNGDPLAYQAVSAVTVSTTGAYVIQDVFNFNQGVDVSIMVYEGSFDPANPQDNVVTPDGIDVFDSVDLNAGIEYVFVMQQWCENVEGAWAVSVSGDGTVSSSLLAELPDYTAGEFDNSGGTADLSCSESAYVAEENVTVMESGTYYYTDLSILFDVDMCLHIYQGSFDPGNPGANLVATLDDIGSVELQSGTNYVLVAQPFAANDVGEFFYALAPPAPFTITSNLAGSWAYPVTDGTGIFMDVFDQNNLMFIAWFTFDLERPDGSVTAMIGDPGHRWVTGIGPFDGNTATLDLYWTSGMVFDSGDPPPDTVGDGTMVIDFDNCIAGNVTYDLGTFNRQGAFPISRLAVENQALCEARYAGPGSPGLL